MKKLTKIFVLSFCAMLFVITSSTWAEKDLYPGKKIIVFGRVPHTKYIRKNIRDMEKVAFDGLIISDGQGWNVWSNKRLDPKSLQPTIDNLKATKFKRFTDNFIMLKSCFLTKEVAVDWFDPKWSTIAIMRAEGFCYW